LDRFVGARFAIGYDARIEESILTPYGPDGVAMLAKIRAMRDKIGTARLQKIMSTRAVRAAALLLADGFDAPAICEELTVGWTSEEKGKVL
jgi:hypothetical protein